MGAIVQAAPGMNWEGDLGGPSGWGSALETEWSGWGGTRDEMGWGRSKSQLGPSHTIWTPDAERRPPIWQPWAKPHSQEGRSPVCLKGPMEVPSSPKRTPPLPRNHVQASVTTHNGRKFILSPSLSGFFSVALERPRRLGAATLPVVNLRAKSESCKYKAGQSRVSQY